jgi:hypothetical protein
MGSAFYSEAIIYSWLPARAHLDLVTFAGSNDTLCVHLPQHECPRSSPHRIDLCPLFLPPRQSKQP